MRGEERRGRGEGGGRRDRVRGEERRGRGEEEEKWEEVVYLVPCFLSRCTRYCTEGSWRDEF